VPHAEPYAQGGNRHLQHLKANLSVALHISIFDMQS